MDSSEENDSDEGGSGGFQVELLASYLSFGRRAIRSRLLVAGAVLLAGVGLTVAALAFLPKTFSCTTVLLTMGNPVLDGRDGLNPFLGAGDLIMRHENLTSIIQNTGLVAKVDERRPPLMKLKDRISQAISGPLDTKSKVASLVGTLETKIEVSTEKGNLSIKVDWSDAQSTAEIAEAARESFLKARRTAEISAFEEKMSILDGHATTLRSDIDVLAQQLQAAREERLGRARQEGKAKAAEAGVDGAAAPPAPRFVVTTKPAEPDAALPELNDKLDGAKKKLAELQTDRERRLHEAQSKYEEMKLRLTPMHPEVITQGERVAMLSSAPSEEALLSAEVHDLEGEIKQRGFAKQGATTFGIAAAGSKAASNAGPLPSEITELLDRDNLDPALVAQLSSTVIKYGALRNDLLSARIDLDTAQAAFNHRYQIIVPADVPIKPIKPKPAVIVGAGVFLSLLLALLIPIALELRTGIMIERWQVQHHLPVLAEPRLPPYSPD